MESSPQSEILVIGVGGGGCSIANHVRDSLGLRTVAISDDKKSLQQFSDIEKLLIGGDINKGFGILNIAQARKAVENHQEKLMHLIRQAKTLVIVAGLGGNTGSGAGTAIIEMARKLGKDVVAVVTMPFMFESKGRKEIATSSLELIRRTGARLIIYDLAAEITLDRSRSCSLNEVLSDAANALSERLKTVCMLGML